MIFKRQGSVKKVSIVSTGPSTVADHGSMLAMHSKTASQVLVIKRFEQMRQFQVKRMCVCVTMYNESSSQNDKRKK